MNAFTTYLLPALLVATSLPVLAGFEVADRAGRIEIRDGDKTVFGWQHQPLPNPEGGEIFAGSAFIHPLSTPSGFCLTRIQPHDHLHHFGVWWPWKKVEVEGKSHVTWEMQQLEGRTRAVSAKVEAATADEVRISGSNVAEIKHEGGDYRVVLNEQVELRIARMGKDTYLVDIDISQRPADGVEVLIPKYRYSGFSWRGPKVWNQENSTMRSSGGHDRDHANHQQARWVSVDGKTPGGMATMLMMSGASMDGGQPERLRVWGSNMDGGTPFANFNPVAKESIPLTADQRAVSHRRYRLVVADRAILPAEAEQLWQQWQQ